MQFSSINPVLFNPEIRPCQVQPFQVRVSNDNEGVFCIPQTSSITGNSPSDCLLSYSGHLLRETYPSTDVQLVYSTALADCAMIVEGSTL